MDEQGVDHGSAASGGMSARDRDGAGGIQVIARAAAILRVLRDDPGGLSLGQIADRAGLPRSTVQRIVGALADERFVLSSGSGGIRLGPDIAALSTAAQGSIVEACRAPMAALAARLGETVDLSVLRGDRMVFLAQVPGTHRLRAVSAVGDGFPLTDTANGRAALAALEPAAALALARAEWAARGLRPDADGLGERLDAIRRTRVAADIDEHTAGISALGMAFADASGAIHAVSVPVPSSRFARLREDVAMALIDCVDAIAARVG